MNRRVNEDLINGHKIGVKALLCAIQKWVNLDCFRTKKKENLVSGGVAMRGRFPVMLLSEI